MIPFSKIHGIGNDFVCLDLVGNAISEDWARLAKRVCDRHFGIGADGLILVEPGNLAAFRMRMFNPDGSEAEMCGNGTRCVALLLTNAGYVSGGFELEVSGKTHRIEPAPNGEFRVEMGRARVVASEVDLKFESLRGWVVDVGNPHAVIFVDDVSAVPLETWGPLIENDLTLFENRTNVHFVTRQSDELTMRTWERGAGVTLACGSGACAVARAAAGEIRHGFLVHLPGGDLTVEMGEQEQMAMTGPAELVFNGTLAP
ncbi:MAG: diaminopimelate epimerase [Fimbriimonadaceae bacterium]